MRFDQLAEWCNGTLLNNVHEATLFHGVSIDSRTLKEQELFIAINGEQNDGHQYINQVISRASSAPFRAWVSAATF